MKNESVKKSLEKSKNVLEEKRKMVKRKIKRTITFTIIAMNFVQEQLINLFSNSAFCFLYTSINYSLIILNKERSHNFSDEIHVNLFRLVFF